MLVPAGYVTPIERRREPHRMALRVALYYLAFGFLWFFAAGWIVRTLSLSVDGVSTVLPVVGGLFVVLSAGVLYQLARQALGTARRSELRLELLTEQLLAGLFLVRDGRVADANERLAEMLGYERDELLEKRAADLVHPDDRQRARDFGSAVAAGEVRGSRLRVRMVRSDGQILHGDIVASPIETEGGKASIGLLLDSTEQVRLEEQFRRAQRMEVLGQLTGAIAHDFNNLLTAILGPLELSVQRIGEEHPLQEDLVLARDTAKRAASLSRQLLTFSRKRMSQRRVFDLGLPVEELRPLVERLTGESVEVDIELAAEALPIVLDPAHLEQVLVNLAVNAAEAMPEGGRLAIRTYAVTGSPDEIRHRGDAETGPHAVLEVADSGVGIPEEVRLQIFEPFFTTKKKGTGLGLSTVFGIVDQAGGFVRVESEPGRGTTFRVFLPITDRALSPKTPAKGEEASAEPAEERSATVLVVEDEEPVRRVLCRVLESWGYEVHLAEHGEAALELWEEVRPRVDLLIADFMLPGIGGRELAERLLEDRPDLAVVFASGYVEREVLEERSDEWGGLFLEKPFTLEKLEEVTREALTAAESRPSTEG